MNWKKNSKSKVKFKNSLKENLRRWKIGIGQNDFVSVTHFGQGMEQVRWQDDWNSFQTSHFFQCRKFLFFGGSVYLWVRNAMIVYVFTQPSYQIFRVHNRKQKVKSKVFSNFCDTILFSDSCIFLFVSHIFNPITKAYPPIRKRYHPRFKKWWIYDILSSFDRFRFWKRFSNKWKSLQMAARIKGKMERTSSWSYLCRRIGFLTAAPRVVQPRRIAAQDWLSHSKLSISRQSQNNSFPLKVYTSVASSKLYNCYVFIFCLHFVWPA